MLDGVILTPLRRIPSDAGDVLHGIKASDPGYVKFGEAYFSTIHYGTIKPWKRHNQMTLNLVVPCGCIRFVLYDDRPESTSYGRVESFILSPDDYHRLTVPPGIWMAFQGVSQNLNLVLNIADIEHDPKEADRADIDLITFDWSLKP
jgi:dTDP-4-dehydrorhamnose 3,5-epimerase